MRRREFVAGLGSAAAWPTVARAQQSDRVRRVGILMPFEESNPDAKIWLSWFTQGLGELGWTDGRNLRMAVRWAGADVERIGMFAKELVGLQPDVILVTSTPAHSCGKRERSRSYLLRFPIRLALDSLRGCRARVEI
jgi:putative tryptophan/tyrosine transport system substrate-binding protein